MKSIVEGKIAGKSAYDIIDRTPKMIQDDPSSIKPVKSQIKGHIEFKDVTFRYPSRKEQTVLKRFTATFEAGKTTALVGSSNL
jgi:ATP-binding cassette, subfamily B (MDR/TAP), member 1